MVKKPGGSICFQTFSRLLSGQALHIAIPLMMMIYLDQL
jgi:hypothetical protein